MNWQLVRQRFKMLASRVESVGEGMLECQISVVLFLKNTQMDLKLMLRKITNMSYLKRTTAQAFSKAEWSTPHWY